MHVLEAAQRWNLDVGTVCRKSTVWLHRRRWLAIAQPQAPASQDPQLHYTRRCSRKARQTGYCWQYDTKNQHA